MTPGYMPSVSCRCCFCMVWYRLYRPTLGAVPVRSLQCRDPARHKLPAIYTERSFVAAGGLISYGADYIDQYRQTAGYVDRILKDEKPADLPV
jgi:hypothetical protein